MDRQWVSVRDMLLVCGVPEEQITPVIVSAVEHILDRMGIDSTNETLTLLTAPEKTLTVLRTPFGTTSMESPEDAE